MINKTEVVRDVIRHLGVNRDIEDYKQELKRRRVDVHPTVIYKERRLLRTQAAEAKSKLIPVPLPVPSKAAEPVVARNETPAPQTAPSVSENGTATLRIVRDNLDDIQGKVAKVRTLAQEVGGYENLQILASIAERLKL